MPELGSDPTSADDDASYAVEIEKTTDLPDVIEPGTFDLQFMFDPGSGPQLQWISFTWDGSSSEADWIQDYGDNTGAFPMSSAPAYGWASWLHDDGVLIAYYSDELEVEKAERVSCSAPTEDPQSWIELGRAIVRSLMTAVLPPTELEAQWASGDDDLFDDAPDEIEPGHFGFVFAYNADCDGDRQQISFIWDGGVSAKWVQDIADGPGLSPACSAPAYGWASWRFGAAIIAYQSDDMGIEGWARAPGIVPEDSRGWVRLARAIGAAISGDYRSVPGMTGEQYL